ncbi:glycosyltransferase family 4 protein [Aquipuribacter nitratireducens]|uniref:Glycosyltransferase family 4 protein n=1 Tax=Aquipuribacter nitratireducens TaxID=650104 RepID=A0ABW0GPM0_9MICO
MSRRVAYLTAVYPALSCAFIDREVDALRAEGREVVTFSVRPPSPTDLGTEAARGRAAATPTILGDGVLPVLAAVARLALRRPGVLVRGLRRAVGTGAPRLRSRVWQVFYLLEAVRLLELMRAAEVRHVHVHFANNAADIARAAVALGGDLDGAGSWSWSFSMHGPTELEDPVGFDVAAKVRSADFVACISDFCRSQLMRWTTPQEWDRLYLVRMSVDAERYRPTERPDRDPAAPLRVLFVGRLVPEKGPSVLLDAVRRMPDVPLEVQVVGAGDLADDLAAVVARHGLGDRVRLVGPLGQDELPARYGWADVLCLPSFAEGLPVVLMEAMATGLPVVTTPIAGVGELVEDGVSGLLCPPGRADLLAACLRRLAEDPALRRRLGARGQQRVRQEFLPGPNAAALDALLPG